MDDVDDGLLAALTTDARSSVAALARRLGLARSTVQERIGRLERAGVIAGYTVRLGPAAQGRRLVAQVELTVDPKRSAAVVVALTAIPEVRTLHTVAGPYDMVATVAADATDVLDAVLDRIGAVPGVDRTTSAVLLTTKIDR